MIVVTEDPAEVRTPSGPMRVHVVRPAVSGSYLGRYPGVVFYSEIFR